MVDNSIFQALHSLAKKSLGNDEVWLSILSQMYLDIEILNDTIFDEVASSGATLSRVALGTAYPPVYGDEQFDAFYVVNSARTGILSAIPEEMHSKVIERLSDIEYLRGVPVPTLDAITHHMKQSRNGQEAHGYRDLKNKYASLYNRSAIKEIASKDSLPSDILALVILSDQSAFDSHLVSISIDHRDWLLNSVAVRKALYTSFIKTNFDSQDIYQSVCDYRSTLLESISNLQDAERNVNWAFNIESLEAFRRQPEPSLI